jgi:hypothetical protein
LLVRRILENRQERMDGQRRQIRARSRIPAKRSTSGGSAPTRLRARM